MAVADAEHRRRAEQVGALGQRRAAARRRAARPPRRAAARDSDAEHDPDQVGEGRVAQRAAALELRRRGSRRRRGGRRGRCSGPRAPGSGRSPLPRPRRGRCARRAGRPSRRSAPRRGSRGSAGSRRRRGSRSASPRGSRGPWRPSGCRPGRRSRASPKRSRMRAWAPRPAAVSESRRKTGIGASRSASSASIRSVPAPARESVVEPHSGQARGSGSAWAQWWQTRRPLWRWTISETSQLGQLPVAPAGAAGEPGGEAAAVDHHDRLGAGPAHPLQRLPGGRVQRARARVGVAHVEHLDRRQPAAVDAARQLEPRQLQPGLRPRRRGAGDEHRAALVGAAAGDRAGVVAGVALLLVGGVVLLVDHDQAEVRDRGEDAERGPTQTLASPLRSRRHSS